MIELTSAGDKRSRLYNPDKIVSVGTFIRRPVVASPGGGSTFGSEEDGEVVSYILLQGADDVDEVVETNAEVALLIAAWKRQAQSDARNPDRGRLACLVYLNPVDRTVGVQRGDA